MTPISSKLFTEEFVEDVGNESIRIEINRPHPEAPIGVFSLHGAGPSNRVRANYLANWFGEEFGLSTLRFDYSGQGDSSGEMNKSSLKKRLTETRAIAQHLGSRRYVLIGTSMGAHLAALIAKEYDFENLVLFCPAAYGKKAGEKDFDDDFTSAIRESESWADSPVWNALRAYNGNASIIIGSRDAIIPKGVLSCYLDALRERSTLVYHSIEGAPHNIHDWLNKNSAERDHALSIIRANLSKLT